MKLANFVFGMVLFSIITTMMFAAIQSISSDNNFVNDDEWETLAGDYNTFTGKISSKSNSTSRLMGDQTGEGVASSEDKDVRIISGALSGGRLATNFYANFNEIVQKVTADSSVYIDPRIPAAIVALIGVFIILVVLHFIRGFKTET